MHSFQVWNGGFGFLNPSGARRPLLSTSGVTMLRSIRSTAFLGTILLTGAAVAQTKAPPSDENLIEGSTPSDTAEAPAIAPAKVEPAPAPTPVAVPAPPPAEEVLLAEIRDILKTRNA